MEMNTYTQNTQTATLPRIVSGTLMIAGTTIGAGMLGIPLVTSASGFLPAVIITLAVWLFMVCTGLLFLEASLVMPQGSNVLSISEHFFGKKGKWFAGAMFVFLYYCLMTAYFAGGAPLMQSFFENLFSIKMNGWSGLLCYGSLFGLIVALGAKSIDRVNIILTAAMILSYVGLVGAGSSEVNIQLLERAEWSALVMARPVLFSAFGYHNVIPSLCTYLQRDKTALRLSIFAGTSIALIVYLVWQWLIIGSVSDAAMQQAQELGIPATQALQTVTGKPFIFLIGQYFAFFAIVTSMLGVAFSLVDFLKDGIKASRGTLVVLTFLPPLLFAALYPAVFDKALGLAGGFGEAILNGALPIAWVWAGRYLHRNTAAYQLPGGKISLSILMACSLFVIVLESVLLMTK
jgi:tyrosine-specific transport protein